MAWTKRISCFGKGLDFIGLTGTRRSFWSVLSNNSTVLVTRSLDGNITAEDFSGGMEGARSILVFNGQYGGFNVLFLNGIYYIFFSQDWILKMAIFNNSFEQIGENTVLKNNAIQPKIFINSSDQIIILYVDNKGNLGAIQSNNLSIFSSIAISNLKPIASSYFLFGNSTISLESYLNLSRNLESIYNSV